jgi:hypothetical protein
MNLNKRIERLHYSTEARRHIAMVSWNLNKRIESLVQSIGWVGLDGENRISIRELKDGNEVMFKKYLRFFESQ